ncbi:MAG: hypothetical protein HC897_12510 [Thermoanaerobaculia bacterium]|nr:hypothetical protein [Thermoanaerobaculia bacterium]
MSTMAMGWIHGKIVELDDQVPKLEGRRVRLVLEPVEDSELNVMPSEQRRLWRQWVESGPQGPIEDDEAWEVP